MVGGLQALLLQAAHPQVVAAVDDTGQYTTDPWLRLETTLQPYLSIIFGSRAVALDAARRINRRHRSIAGLDYVTGERYSGRDPALLLWVHVALVSSFLRAEGMTLGTLGPDERDRFVAEQATVARLLGLPRAVLPTSVASLESVTKATIRDGTLRCTPGALRVAEIVRHPPRAVPFHRALRVAQAVAFAGLPPEVRQLYGLPHREPRAVAVACRAMRRHWRQLPPRHRFIAPYRQALARVEGLLEIKPGGLFWDMATEPSPSSESAG